MANVSIANGTATVTGKASSIAAACHIIEFYQTHPDTRYAEYYFELTFQNLIGNELLNTKLHDAYNKQYDSLRPFDRQHTLQPCFDVLHDADDDVSVIFDLYGQGRWSFQNTLELTPKWIKQFEHDPNYPTHSLKYLREFPIKIEFDYKDVDLPQFIVDEIMTISWDTSVTDITEIKMELTVKNNYEANAKHVRELLNDEAYDLTADTWDYVTDQYRTWPTDIIDHTSDLDEHILDMLKRINLDSDENRNILSKAVRKSFVKWENDVAIDLYTSDYYDWLSYYEMAKILEPAIESAYADIQDSKNK